jgi:hypothetical protein
MICRFVWYRNLYGHHHSAWRTSLVQSIASMKLSDALGMNLEGHKSASSSWSLLLIFSPAGTALILCLSERGLTARLFLGILSCFISTFLNLTAQVIDDLCDNYRLKIYLRYKIEESEWKLVKVIIDFLEVCL